MPETTTTRRNWFSALYSKSESDISDYRSAEEKSPNRTEDYSHPEALTPDEFDLLASLTIIEGVEPLEPLLENRPNPFQRLISEILTTNRNSERNHWPEPRTGIEMATDNKNGTVKLNLPKAFDGSWDKFRKFLQTTEIYLGINKKVYNNDLKKIGFILSFMTEG